MTKTQALKIAKKHVYMSRMGSGWIVICPHDYNDLNGAVRKSHQFDYHKARYYRQQNVGWLALRLLGYHDDGDIFWALDNHGATIDSMVTQAIETLSKVKQITDNAAITETIAGRNMLRGSGILDQTGQVAWLVADIRNDKIVATFPVSEYGQAVDAMIEHGKAAGTLVALGADFGPDRPVIIQQTY